MFSLQKMLDDMGRKRQERRFASRSKARLMGTVEKVYGVSIEKLKAIFPPHLTEGMPENFPSYIELRNLEEFGIGAFLVRQTIEVTQLPGYITAIRDGREEINWQHYKSGTLHTLVKHDQELSGVNMRLLTNDGGLLRHLASGDFNPPCPWVSFYELGPFVGSMQGNAEYWYHHVWDKYWEGLSLAEQAEFLERQRRESAAFMPDEEWQEWVDGLRFRDPRTRDSLSSGDA